MLKTHHFTQGLARLLCHQPSHGDTQASTVTAHKHPGLKGTELPIKHWLLSWLGRGPPSARKGARWLVTQYLDPAQGTKCLRTVLGCRQPSEVFQALPQACSAPGHRAAPSWMRRCQSRQAMGHATAPASSAPTHPSCHTAYAFPSTPCPCQTQLPECPLCVLVCSLPGLQCPPQLHLCPSSCSSNVTLLTGLLTPAQVTSEIPPEAPEPSGLSYLSRDVSPRWGGESVPRGEAQSSPTPAPGSGGAFSQ